MYVLVNGFYSNWTSWLVPNMQVPLTFVGDGLSVAVFLQRQLEGSWFFENMRMGYPFVSTLYEYPKPLFDMLMTKFVGLFSPSWIEAYAWLYLLGYVPIFVAAYAVLRSWQVSIAWSVIGALAFDMMSTHHERLNHMAYVWYFFVPIVCAYAWRIWRGESLWDKSYRWRNVMFFVIIGFFNAYWTFMTSLVMILASLGGALRERNWRILRDGVIVVAVIAVGLVINYTPSWSYNFFDPTDISLARKIEDSDTFALWLSAVITPAPLYTALGQSYNAFLLAQGMASEHDYNPFLASIGLAGLMLVLPQRLLGRNVHPFLLFLATISIGIMLYAMVGGIGLGVSLYVTSFVRGINRIMFYLSFIGIAALVWGLSRLLGRLPAHHRWLHWPIVGLALVSVWHDSALSQVHYEEQTWSARQQQWQRESVFYRDAQQLIGATAAVYQLPIVSFPEVDGEYRQTRCYLYSTLFCSHGTFHGRDAHQFFVALQAEPMARQVDIAARLGFDAIEITRNLFADRYPTLEADLQQVLGRGPDLVSPDGQIALYKLTPTGPRQARRSIADVVAQSQFLRDEYQLTQRDDIAIPIDFGRPWWPGSVHAVSGMDEYTPEGRWNNATQRRIVIRFTQDLPDAFHLHITGRAWNKAVGAPIEIRVANMQSQMVFGHELSTQQVEIRGHRRTNTLIIVPPYQGRASERDLRYISLFVRTIQITPLP
jgi:phosphoglycerol transferase